MRAKPSGARQAARAEEEFRAAARLVAEACYGEVGVRTYQVFDALNAAYFHGELPTPWVSWELTPHSACLGHTRADGRPHVTLHPALLGGREKRNPWGVPTEQLGWRFAADTLLHECIHVLVGRRSGGWKGRRGSYSSHNDEPWVTEVNRLIPLLGLEGVASRCYSRRLPVEGPVGARGRPPTRIVRAVQDGALPFPCVAGFPRALRQHRGEAARYYRGEGAGLVDGV